MSGLIFSVGARVCYAIVLGTAWFSASAMGGILDGQQLSLEVNYPTKTDVQFTYGPFTVGPNPQVVVTSTPPLVNFTATASDDSITITYPGSAHFAVTTFNGYVLTEVASTAPSFISAVVDPGSTFALDQSRVTFDDHNVYMNVSGLSAQAGQHFTVDFTPVPEPSVFWLLGFSAVGILVFMRGPRRVSTR